MESITFDNEKNTWKDWRLRITSIVIGYPEPKLVQTQVPGMDGILDRTEEFGPVRYSNRKIQIIFDYDGDYDTWSKISAEISNYLHGINRKVVLSTDPGYYYVGRLKFETTKSNDVICDLKITGDMEPYKYETAPDDGNWLWDPFSFEDGIIREYGNIQVEGQYTMVVPGRKKPVVPIITASDIMTVEFRGMTYTVEVGRNKLYDVILTEGENTLIFRGNGVITLEYKGGIL